MRSARCPRCRWRRTSRSALQHGADQPVLRGEGAGEQLLLKTRLRRRDDLAVEAHVVAVDAGLVAARVDGDGGPRRVAAAERLGQAALEVDVAGGEAGRLEVGD